MALRDPSTEARDRSLDKLADTLEQLGDITRTADEARRLREKNHFAPAIADLFATRRAPRHRGRSE
jgi:hypothetical protein